MTSLYENLKIYKSSLDLTTHIEKVVKNFNRNYKYSIGDKLRDLSMRILVLIAKANNKSTRIESLEDAINLLEELRIVVRVCREVHCFKSLKSFEFASKSIVDLLRQFLWMREEWILFGMKSYMLSTTRK